MNASLPATARDPSALQAELTAVLSRIVSDDALLWEHEGITPYECGGLVAYWQAPLAVVLPDVEAQVAEILRVRHHIGVPMMPRGAGTSLSDGAMPTLGGLVLSLARLRRVIRVDPYTRTTVVRSGVRNLAISEAVNSRGLYYTPDPSSRITCTIGDNMDGDSGGMRYLKYDLTVHNVLRARIMMTDGEVVEFGSKTPDASDFGPLAAVVSSEGMLAAVTEVTMRLISRPQLAQVIITSFDDVESGGNAVADVIAAGIIPAGLEMTDKPTTAAVEEFACVGYSLDTAAVLLYESDGTPEEVAEEVARVSEVPRASGAIHIQVLQSEAECLKSQSGRKNAFPAAGRVSPDYYCMDGTIPRKHISTLLRRIRQMEQKYTLYYINVLHAGNDNMHLLILFNGKDQGEWHRAELFGFDILETCVEPGDTVMGGHGVDVEKFGSMCV